MTVYLPLIDLTETSSPCCASWLANWSLLRAVKPPRTNAVLLHVQLLRIERPFPIIILPVFPVRHNSVSVASLGVAVFASVGLVERA